MKVQMFGLSKHSAWTPDCICVRRENREWEYDHNYGPRERSPPCFDTTHCAFKESRVDFFQNRNNGTRVDIPKGIADISTTIEKYAEWPDGTYTWETPLVQYSKVRYTPGPKVKAWMEEKDRNYILRLAHEGQLYDIELKELYEGHQFYDEILEIIKGYQQAKAEYDGMSPWSRLFSTSVGRYEAAVRKAKEEKLKQLRTEREQTRKQAELERQRQEHTKHEAVERRAKEAERKAQEAKAQAAREQQAEEAKQREKERIEQEHLQTQKQIDITITRQVDNDLAQITQQSEKISAINLDLATHQQILNETEAKLHNIEAQLVRSSSCQSTELESQRTEINQLVARYRKEQYEYYQCQYIQACPPLYDYYMTLRIQLCCSFTAAQAIHSQLGLMVDVRQCPASKTQRVAQQVIKLADFIPLLGPMLKTTADYLVQGLGMISETIDKKRLMDGVNRLVGTNGIASDQTEMSTLAEEIARLLTFGKENELMNLPSPGGVVAQVKTLKEWIDANPHDSPAKRKAADDVKKLLAQIMKKGLTRHEPKEKQLITMVLGICKITIPSSIPNPQIKKQATDNSAGIIQTLGIAASVDPLKEMEARLRAEFAAQMAAQAAKYEKLLHEQQAQQPHDLQSHLKMVDAQLQALSQDTQAEAKEQELKEFQLKLNTLQERSNKLQKEQKVHANQLLKLKSLVKNQGADAAANELGLDRKDGRQVQLSAVDLKDHNEKARVIQLEHEEVKEQIAALLQAVSSLMEKQSNQERDFDIIMCAGAKR